MIALAIGLIFALIITLEFMLLSFKNYRAHQFYDKHPSKLPYLKNANIISGHYFQIIVPPHNIKVIDKLHNQLGDTFGYYVGAQPWISTKDIELLRILEVDEAHKHIDRVMFGLPFKEFNDSIFQLLGDNWRRVRRAITPALSNKMIKSDDVSLDIRHVLERMMSALERRKRTLAKNGSKSLLLNCHNLFQRYTLAVIFLITYDRENAVDFEVENDQWTDTMNRGAGNIRNPLVWLSMMVPFSRPLCYFLAQFSEIGQSQLQILDYIAEAVDKRRADHDRSQLSGEQQSSEQSSEQTYSDGCTTGQRNDNRNQRRRLIDTIIDSYYSKQISYTELLGTALFLMLAGFETTADTITCMTWHLAMNQDIQDKLRDSILKEGEDSQYLDWCIKETIRIHPAVPLGAGRIVKESLTVNGNLIPEGAFVMPSTYSIHHDEQIWGKDCHDFKPDRWIKSNQFHSAQFMGFGLGPRNCVGGKIATYEIKLVMCRLLTRYRIETCNETVKEYNFTSPGLIWTILDEPIIVKLVEIDPLSNNN